MKFNLANRCIALDCLAYLFSLAQLVLAKESEAEQSTTITLKKKIEAEQGKPKLSKANRS